MPETMTKEDVQRQIEEAIGVKMKDFTESLKANGAAADSEAADIKADIARAKATSDVTVKTFRSLPAEEKLKSAALLLAAVAHAPRDPLAASKAAKEWGDNFVAKTLSGATIAGGGVLMPPEFATEFIELLRELSVIKRAGPRPVQMDSQVLQFGGVATGAVAAYRGEATPAAYSEPTTRGLELHARLLAVQCAASEQFLRVGQNNVQFVQDELQQAASARMDLAAIRGTGALNTPRGLRFQAVAGNVYAEACAAAAANGSTLGEVANDLTRMMASVKAGDLQLVKPVWLINTNAWRRLFSQQNAVGQYIWREEMSRKAPPFDGTINGIPFIETGLIPTNLVTTYAGGALVASELYLFDAWQFLMGETKALTVKASSDASYHDATGALVSAFERGETVFDVEMEHDFALRQASKCAVLTNNTWT
jgi:HK97 family phage major capsid protein